MSTRRGFLKSFLGALAAPVALAEGLARTRRPVRRLLRTTWTPQKEFLREFALNAGEERAFIGAVAERLMHDLKLAALRGEFHRAA